MEGNTNSFVEANVAYKGERSSAFAFFLSFPDIIFRKDGSVIPKVMVETLLALCVSFLASSVFIIGGPLYPDSQRCGDSFFCISESRPEGHAILGALLSFFAVFRSQIAWGLHSQGRDAIGELMTVSRALAMDLLLAGEEATDFQQAIDNVDSKSLERGLFLAKLTLENIRLIKLFYFTVVEHCRSTDGFPAWAVASELVAGLTTDAEELQLFAEYGGAQEDGRKQVVIGSGGKVVFNEDSCDIDVDPDLAELRSQFPNSIRGPKSERNFLRVLSESHGKSNPATVAKFHDPTSSKPLLVLVWLRQNINSMKKRGLIEAELQHVIVQKVDKLSSSYSAVDKIDKFVLPLPYCQLLKIFELFYVFTLPFVLA